MIGQNRNIRGIRIGKTESVSFTICRWYCSFSWWVGKKFEICTWPAFSVWKIFWLKAKYCKNQSNMDRVKRTILGVLSNDSGILCTEPFNILGIIFTANLCNIVQLNFDEKLATLQKEINQWSKINISPTGKIII